MRGFYSHGIALRTFVLHYNKCATPAKLPFCKCPIQYKNYKNLHIQKIYIKIKLIYILN